MEPSHQPTQTADPATTSTGRAVDRAAGDLRRGLPVIVRGPEAAVLAVSAEQAGETSYAALVRIAASAPVLAVTAARAAVLRVPPDGRPVSVLELPPRFDADAIRAIADPTTDLANPLRGPFRRAGVTPGADIAAAVELCKIARLLPAAVVAPVPAGTTVEAIAARENLLAVDAGDIDRYPSASAVTLRQVTSARVPLAGVADVEIVAFRPGDGSIEHLALIVGDPNRHDPVLARLHSECFTGDLLESLRCDCGTQLRAAILRLASEQGGVLLYLAQEGRGIGLINKLRAYRLQDQGFDTFDANARLGFEADERVFAPAAEMLRRLGFSRVRLLTNNPDKVRGLEQCGIEVVERVRHAFPANPHNAHYLDTKARRGGHLL
jgi:GTP cyclohydrolase II